MRRARWQEWVSNGFECNARFGCDGFADPYPPHRPLPPLPAEWGSLPRAFVIKARARWSSEAMADSTGVRLTYGKTLISAPAPGSRPRSKLGNRGTRRLAGATDRSGRRGQSRRDALGQGPGQPQLLGQPEPGGRLDRPVRDHARLDFGESARSIQDHPQGAIDPARRNPQTGATGRQALGRRCRQTGANPVPGCICSRAAIDDNWTRRRR